jgi:hypothetical protein
MTSNYSLRPHDKAKRFSAFRYVYSPNLPDVLHFVT